MDVGCPFEFCGVGVAGAYVAGLKLLELLLRAEFVCLVGEGGGVSWVWKMGWGKSEGFVQLTIIEIEVKRSVGDG